MEVKVSAPAKINLTLDVVGKRSDGYHNIETILQAVSLYDNVTVTENDSKTISVSCTQDDIPCDESNIAHRAAVCFFKYTGMQNRGIHIHICKNIPSQAGLGGGSSDGAAVVLALNFIYDARLKENEMCEICEKVGADVPFCLVGGTRLAKETGAVMTKLHNLPKCKIVICKPPVNVSTREAYDLVDSAPYKSAEITDLAIRSIYSASMPQICATLYNDFEVALKLADVTNVKKIMYKHKAKGASMSGSGSAVFGIFSSEKSAEKCAEALKKEYGAVFITEPIKCGCKIVS